MDIQQKLNLLGDAAGFDVDEAKQVDTCATAGASSVASAGALLSSG